MSEQIPYDEMRRILGLPDVRDEVILMRLRAMAGRRWPGYPYLFHTAEYGTPRHQGAVVAYLGGRPPRWVSDLVVRASDAAGFPPPPPWQVDAAAARLLRTMSPRAPIGAAKDLEAAIAPIRTFIAAMNEFARAAAAATAVPTTFYPPKPKKPTGPRLPRPSHTPPPWAQDPTRTRRTKNSGIDMRTPRV